MAIHYRVFFFFWQGGGGGDWSLFYGMLLLELASQFRWYHGEIFITYKKKKIIIIIIIIIRHNKQTLRYFIKPWMLLKNFQ